MWKATFTAGALAIALAAMPAVAQQTPAAQLDSPAAAETPAAQEQNRSAGDQTPSATDLQARPADLSGMPVYSSDGEKLGEVVNIRVSGTGKVEAVHFEIGGFLGMGAKTVEVESGDFTEADDRINLLLTADQAKELPEAP